MARTRKPETAAAETAQGTSFSSAERPSRQPAAAQETQDTQGLTQDAQAQETAPDGTQGAAESAQEVQEGQDTQPQETGHDGAQGGRAEKNLPSTPLEYAVAGCKFLNLRERPGLDAPVVAQLPCGAGVFLFDEAVSQADGHWRRVHTGTLDGWMMSLYLEPVWN